MLLPGNLKCLRSTTSAEKKSSSVESRGTLAKLVVLLKICFFEWDIEEVFWILIQPTNSEHPRKIEHFGEDLLIFL